MKNFSNSDIISNMFSILEQKTLCLSLYRQKCQYRRKCPISPNLFVRILSAILAFPKREGNIHLFPSPETEGKENNLGEGILKRGDRSLLKACPP